jgi:beta-xylosidase
MKSTSLLAAAAALSSVSAVAGNPLVKGVFTPDPAPFVHGDKVYMFTGHDENDAKFFKMKEWFVFESEDLVNWKSLGAPLSLETFAWAKKDDKAWASQAVERNGGAVRIMEWLRPNFKITTVEDLQLAAALLKQ